MWTYLFRVMSCLPMLFFVGSTFFYPFTPKSICTRSTRHLCCAYFRTVGNFFIQSCQLTRMTYLMFQGYLRRIKKVFIYYCYNTYLMDLDKWASIPGQAWVLEIPLNYLQLVSPKIFGLPWYVTNATCIFFIQGTIK